MEPGPHLTRQRCFDPLRRVKTASNGARRAAGSGFDGTERTGTRSDGRRQGRNSVDSCGEDRA